MAWLSRRDRRPEVMDQPDLDPDRHRQALNALRRINVLSACAATLYGPLRQLQADLGAAKLRVLDVASGGGDVAVRLWRRAAEAGLDWRVAGCDVSPVAVGHAREYAFREAAPVHFFQLDALRQPIEGAYDAVVCSLFLHHLDDDDAVALLRAMARVNDDGSRLVLVNDLDRSLVGLWAAYVGSRLLTTSTVVHTDGPLSVRAAFTPAEAVELARRAGLANATVRRCWPWRWQLTWRRP
jgi:SAM-dependent methyltransferase